MFGALTGEGGLWEPHCAVNGLGPEPSRNSLSGSYRPEDPGPGAAWAGASWLRCLCEALQVSFSPPSLDREAHQGKSRWMTKHVLGEANSVRNGFLFLCGAKKGDPPER